MIRNVLRLLVIIGSVAAGALVLYARLPSDEVAFDPFFTGTTELAWTFVALLPDGENVDYRNLLREAEDNIRSRARGSGAAFSTVGVATEWYIESGLELAGYYGPFDELILGRNVLNTGVLAYILMGRAGTIVSPQVAVFENTMTIEPGVLTVDPLRVMARRTGIAGLSAWKSAGFPLD